MLGDAIVNANEWGYKIEICRTVLSNKRFLGVFDTKGEQNGRCVL